MRLFVPVFLVTTSLAVFSPCLAQLTFIAQEPDFMVTITANGQPLSGYEGIPVSTTTIALSGQLTPLSQQDYPQFESSVLIHRATLNLVRDSKRIGSITWSRQDSLVSLFKEAKSGDRFFIQLDEVAIQKKQGGTQPIIKPKIVKLVVKE